jgi:hypothetical protein
LFGDGAITRKKMTETLHHALRAMMQLPVFFFLLVILHHQTKKIKNKKIKQINK